MLPDTPWMRPVLPSVRVSGGLSRVPQRWTATSRPKDSFSLIEGKRTESLSESTGLGTAGRNQLHRNLEAARELAHGREFGVLIVGEELLPDAALGDSMIGLPHLPERERADLMRHYLGCITWRQVCQATGIDFELVATECRSSDEDEKIASPSPSDPWMQKSVNPRPSSTRTRKGIRCAVRYIYSMS